MFNAREFILSNFAAVAESRDFLNLESQQVEQWISCDKMVVFSEVEVFKIILNWIKEGKSEREGKFVELFRHVRLAFITRDYLKIDVVTNKLVKESSHCLRLVNYGFKLIYHYTNGASPLLSRNWKPTHLVVLVGEEIILCYDPALKLKNGIDSQRDRMFVQMTASHHLERKFTLHRFVIHVMLNNMIRFLVSAGVR